MRSTALHLDRLERRRMPSSAGFAPRIVAPARWVILEDTASPLRVRVVDVDSWSVSVTLRVSSGFLAVRSVPGVAVQAPGARGFVVTGPRDGVNRTLDTVTFQPQSDATGEVAVIVAASDGGHRSVRSGSIRIIPVDDPPTISKPARIFATRGSVSLGRQPLDDVDSARLTVTLASDNGTVRILDPGARNLGRTAVLRGRWQALNAVIGTPGRVILAPAADRNTRLTITASDGSRRAIQVVTVSHRQSLEGIAAGAVDSRIAGLDPAIAKPLFTVEDHATATYVRNAAAWTSDLDLTGVSPWNSAGGEQFAGTLVSPRHVIYATHFQIPKGATVRFVTRSDEVVERTLVGTISLPHADASLDPDITVGVLDRDVPPTIGFASILPDDWAAYLADGPLCIPCLAIDQEEKALVTTLRLLGERAAFAAPDAAPQRSFHEDLVRGDSGHPAFMIVDGQLVLVTVWSYGPAGLGTFVTRQRAAIDAIMAELGGGYRLAPVSLARLGRF